MQNLPKTIRLTFLSLILVLMASMGLRTAIAIQFESPSNKIIADACKDVKGCRHASIGEMRDHFIPTPVIYIHMSASSKITLDELRPVFDRAMANRYETLNKFQKLTQGKYEYEVTYHEK